MVEEIQKPEVNYDRLANHFLRIPLGEVVWADQALRDGTKKGGATEGFGLLEMAKLIFLNLDDSKKGEFRETSARIIKEMPAVSAAPSSVSSIDKHYTGK
jgi:hypothetical protein